jgi:Flp pilus assembly protein CpaB
MGGDAAVASGLIEPRRVLRGSIPTSAVTDTSDLAGKVAAATIQTKQFITSASFVAPSEGGGGSLAAAIGSSNRVAVTISVDPERGVARAIAPGDRVDILVVDGGTATVLLENVKVLAIGSSTALDTGSGETSAQQPADTGLITFELTREDAQRVVGANKSGTLYLTLRPLASGGGSDTAVPATGR